MFFQCVNLVPKRNRFHAPQLARGFSMGSPRKRRRAVLSGVIYASVERSKNGPIRSDPTTNQIELVKSIKLRPSQFTS